MFHQRLSKHSNLQKLCVLEEKERTRVDFKPRVTVTFERRETAPLWPQWNQLPNCQTTRHIANRFQHHSKQTVSLSFPIIILRSKQNYWNGTNRTHLLLLQNHHFLDCKFLCRFLFFFNKNRLNRHLRPRDTEEEPKHAESKSGEAKTFDQPSWKRRKPVADRQRRRFRWVREPSAWCTGRSNRKLWTPGWFLGGVLGVVQTWYRPVIPLVWKES